MSLSEKTYSGRAWHSCELNGDWEQQRLHWPYPGIRPTAKKRAMLEPPPPPPPTTTTTTPPPTTPPPHPTPPPPHNPPPTHPTHTQEQDTNKQTPPKPTKQQQQQNTKTNEITKLGTWIEMNDEELHRLRRSRERKRTRQTKSQISY